MAKTLTYDMDDFKKGLILLNDDSMTPPGSAREMTNVFITDRGGVAPRPGTRMLGARDASTDKGLGFFVMKKSFGDVEIPVKMFGDKMQGYDATYGWFQIKEGFTANDFDALHNFVTTENDDYMYFCNRYEPFQRWSGAYSTITVALVGGETTITVDNTLRPDIFSSTVSTASSATTITQTTETWGTSQWVNMYVYVLDGPLAGEVSKITANTATGLTFDALTGDPGIGTTIEVRMSIYDLSIQPQFSYNGTEITVTDIPTSTTLTVASAHAASIGDIISSYPEEFPEAPRGNRMTVLKGRSFVARVRSGLSRDSAGALQGANVGSTLFGSKKVQPEDFGYAAPRVEGEGIIAAIPFGGGDITDVGVSEGVVYVYKRNYIESFQMNEVDDEVQRRPLKAEAGSVGRIILGRDDHYFITLDKQFTSLGRVADKDLTVQTENIGLPIKRLLDRYEFDAMAGFEFQNRILFSAKSDAIEPENNATLVWNKTNRSFEGAWNIGAHEFDTFNDDLYYMEAGGPNVWKMFETERSDFDDVEELPVAANWQSNFYNLTPIKANYQACNSFAFEGYISAEATFTFKLFKDFATDSSYEFEFGGLDDTEFLQGSTLAAFLGANPLGLQPIGTVDIPGADGRRRFSFLVYIPFLYGEYFSIGFSSHGKNQDWEIIRASLGVRESISTVRPSIRNI
jgi:hypothetical protein